MSRLSDETLRYDYGYERMAEFFSECRLRVDSLRASLVSASPDHLREIERIAQELSNLSSLITLIERSRLGEFSWPFADALRALAGRLCAEIPPHSRPVEPLFFISADGGIDAYRIHPEEDALQYCRTERRIFNIVFPRTLKYHVLLHTILGHEIGHAAWTITELLALVRKEVLNPLVKGSVLETKTAASTWWKDVAPTDNLIQFEDDAYDNETLENWQQEFICDLFGLLLFGPSFLPAHRVLLATIDAEGIHPGWEHPPNISRFYVLSEAADILNWRTQLQPNETVNKNALNKFWSAVSPTADQFKEKLNVFSRQQIESAVLGLKNVLVDHGTEIYQLPAIESLEHALESLRDKVPPVGIKLNKDANGYVHLSNSPLDFRTILFAGWISWYGRGDRDMWKGKPPPTFLDINRLCDQAILQQRAVTLKTGRASGGSVVS